MMNMKKYQAGGPADPGMTADMTRGVPGGIDVGEMGRRNAPPPMPEGLDRGQGMTPEERKKRALEAALKAAAAAKKRKPKGMKSGGKIRGYGMARGGKACKMR
tara:strand:- start:2771 stop:3079 length:309 start_codon:yes stop_codon:yes gene_type:complete